MDYKNKSGKDLMKELDKLKRENESLRLRLADEERIERNLSSSLSDKMKDLDSCEKKFRRLAENIDDVIYEFDKSGIITYVSSLVEKKLGYSTDEITGRDFVQFVGGGEEYSALIFSELHAKRDIVTERKIFAKNGLPRWINISVKAVFEDDVFKGGAGTLTDITGRKIMELELHRNEMLYRSILNSVPDTVTITDLEGKVIFCSPSAGRMFGYEENYDFSGHNILDFIDPADHERAKSKIQSRINNGDSGSGDYTGIRADGSRFDIDVNGDLILDSGGHTVNLIFVTRDSSERKQMEEKLRKLSRAVEQSPVSIVITDTDGIIEYANPKACETTGYSQDELIGVNPRILKSGDTPDNQYSVLWDTISSGREWHGIFHNRKKSGELYWESSTIAPIYDALGKVTHYVAVKEDITSRRQIESEIRDINANLELKIKERTADFSKAMEEAEQANRIKSDFLANMSHEIRTPMNAILGYSELLGSLVNDQTQKDYLNSIKSSGRTLLTLINDILDLSKIEAGKLELEFDYIDTGSFFSEFEKIFAFKTTEKGIIFLTEIASGTPSYVFVDGVRLRQVILNLIGNAVKFTDTGSVSLKVTSENPRLIAYSKIRSEEVVDIIIEVADTGIGIPKEFQNEIFGSFIQVKTKLGHGGTGLGLAISLKLVQLMNGTLEVRSELGKGSVFTVRIPEIPFLRSLHSARSSVNINPANILFEKNAILVVDDVEENRRYLKDALQGTDLTVLEAADGPTALNMMKRTLPGLIITDIRMSAMSGFELLSAIKSNRKLKHIPVIAYSASVMKEQKEKIHKSEFAGLLIKPVSIADLYLELMNILPYRTSTGSLPHIPTANSISASEITDLPGLLSALDGKFYKKWEMFRLRQPIGAIKEFGNSLKILGMEHKCRSVTKYGSELLDAATNFNIEMILNLLKSYSNLAEDLKKSEQ
jgi:PAS domain S-box-containing protein